ncbi:hypothetical protein DICPUDRAFT_152827 [Dictyostelium purpureum]|uniref:Uncharacterized protein n=1 Tax=Dictyostelium purpureum TaxID=5786 RepID=F0ZMD3_DICPU|nr:uncharacterized protein DICPUDRAFT_152827 [Dictyostelium purpureum]EGC34879.1 hypothetical protein DICPUDRAFT_152827 [Dictyostelium purpureum]|eukprot:XP_003288571.1 hypothetical protein DICPUDRAFT_152827 [Dictyostelium purpureum]
MEYKLLFFLIFVFVNIYYIYNDDHSVAKSIINIFNNNNANSIINNIDTVIRDGDLDEFSIEELKKISIFKNYPTKLKEIEQNKKQELEQLNHLKEIYSTYGTYTKLSIIVFGSFSIFFFLKYKKIVDQSYNKANKDIEEEIKKIQDNKNSIIVDEPLLQLNELESNKTSDAKVLFILLHSFKSDNTIQYNLNENDNNNDKLLMYKTKAQEIENKIKEKIKMEKIMKNSLSNTSKLLIAGPTENNSDNNDNPGTNPSEEPQSSPETLPSNINNNINDVDNDGPDNTEGSDLEKEIGTNSSKSNDKPKNIKKNQGANIRFKQDSFKQDKQVKKVFLEYHKEIAVYEYKRFKELWDEANKEAKEIKRKAEEKLKENKEKKKAEEKKEKERQEEKDEISATKYYSLLIKFILILNILPELLKLIKHHFYSLLPTITCLNLNEYFKVTTNDTNRLLAPLDVKYYFKIAINQIFGSISANSKGIFTSNLLDCIPTSAQFNWSLWLVTIIYIVLIIVSLQFQPNFYISSTIFLSIVISTYQINYRSSDINYYLFQFIVNLSIVYFIKKYHQQTKQFKYIFVFRVFIILFIILFNTTYSKYFLENKNLIIVR